MSSNFSGRDDAKQRSAPRVRYLFEGAAGTDRDVVVLEITEIIAPGRDERPRREAKPGATVITIALTCDVQTMGISRKTITPNSADYHPTRFNR